MRNHFMKAAHRGIEFIGSASDTAVSGDFSIDITGIPIQPNDVCILSFVCRDKDPSPGITGFTGNTNKSLFANESEVWTKTLVGNETTVASTTGGDYTQVAAIASVFRGVTLTGIGTSGDSTSNDGNPPDGPISNTVTKNKAVVIPIGTCSNAVWTSPGSPSGYTDAGSVNYAASNYAQVEVAYKIVTAQEDPPAFTGSTTVTTGYCVAFTVTLQEI